MIGFRKGTPQKTHQDDERRRKTETQQKIRKNIGRILKIMKMEHTDENIYYIGNIANSLLKIIRNEE